MSVPQTEKKIDDEVSSGGMSEKAFEVTMEVLFAVVFIAWVAFLGSLGIAFVVGLKAGMAGFWSTVAVAYLPCCGVLTVFVIMLFAATARAR